MKSQRVGLSMLLGRGGGGEDERRRERMQGILAS